VIQNFLDSKGFAANVASDFILGVNLHDDLGWPLHKPIGAAGALVVIPLAAVFTEELATVWILTL